MEAVDVLKRPARVYMPDDKFEQAIEMLESVSSADLETLRILKEGDWKNTIRSLQESKHDWKNMLELRRNRAIDSDLRQVSGEQDNIQQLTALIGVLEKYRKE